MKMSCSHKPPVKSSGILVIVPVYGKRPGQFWDLGACSLETERQLSAGIKSASTQLV